MSAIREFIRSLGADAPSFFQVKPALIERWLKHGQMPLNKVDAAFVVMNKQVTDRVRSELPESTVPSWTTGGHIANTLPDENEVAPEQEVDPAVMEEQAEPLAGQSPRVPQTVTPAALEQASREGLIEVDPYEQNAGSFVHPGRVQVPVQRQAPRIIQKRQTVSPQAKRVERDNTPLNVPVMTPEQYAAAMRNIKPRGATNWAAPRPNSVKNPKDASKLAQRRSP